MRRIHTPEFKLEVVRQVEAGEKSQAQLCREHALSETLLRTWRQQYQEKGAQAWKAPTASADALTEAEKRIAALEAALGRATLETEFLRHCLKKGGLPLPKERR